MTVEQKKRKEQAIQYYISQGYAPHVAAAIVGNLIHESGLRTEVRGDLDNPNGDSVGIAQWHRDRQKQLKNTYGKDWNKFENQLAFIHWELQNTEKLAGEKLKTAKTVEEAGEIFSDLYERPKVKYKQDKDRQARVNETFKSINPSFTNLDKAQNISTFAQELQATPQPQAQQEEEETEELEPEIQEAQQKVKEYSFLKDIEELYQLPPQQQVQLTPQETAMPTIDVLGTYEQASQIIDNPIAQEGGQKKPKIEIRTGLDTNGKSVYQVYKDNTNITRTSEGQKILQQEKDKVFQAKKDKALNTLDAVIDTPQALMMLGLTGKFQKPSDYLVEEKVIDKDNKFMRVATDLVADPTGLVSKVSRPFRAASYYDNYNDVKNVVQPFQQGGIPTSPNGLYDFPNQPVLVNTKDGKITMKNIDYEVLGIDEFGNKQLMQPNKEYQFKGKNILEIPTQFFNGKK